jgi:hypothetical protein
MELQNMFDKYDDQKKLVKSDYDKMTEKRDTIINEIKRAKNIQSFDVLNLGSYKLKTGVKYKDNSYDIDCGLIFNNTEKLDANTLKNNIYESISRSRTKKFKTKCLSAIYQDEGKESFHIDFAIYMKENEQYFLCDGKKDNVKYVKTEPKKLIEYLNYENLEDVKRNKYKRSVRLLKLWKSKVFSQSHSDAVPPSVALNITARQYFNGTTKANDVDILIEVCKLIREQFKENKELLYLELPYSDTKDNVYYKVVRDNKYVTDYKQRLEELLKGLEYARDCSSLDSACKELKKYFPDFPEPDKEQSTSKPNSNPGRYGI